MRAALSSVARPLLHTFHLLSFAVLLLTGLLLFVPSLRAALTGGYSQPLRSIHRWGGIAFMVVPLAVVIACGPAAVLLPRQGRNLRAMWGTAHVGMVVVLWLVFSLTGLAIWDKQWLADSVAESSRSVHDWITYVAALLLGAHLAEVGLAGLLARVRAAVRVQHSQT